MTLLLKSVWRNVLKGSPLSKSLRSRSLTSSIASEVTGGRSPDAVMTSIKAAPSAAEVLAAVNANMPNMNHKHMLQALRCLFELQRSGHLETDPEKLVSNPTFGVLCQNFKKHARALDVNEAIEATKVLSYLKVPADSMVVQTMLQLVRCYINMISIRQIMFLDFLLTKFDCTNHLVDALKLALPLAFQIHLPYELDKKDLPLLKDMLAYSCTHDLPDRYINNIVTGLLLHDQVIDAHIAKSVIWSLCQVNCTEELYPTRVQLLHICYDILTQSIDQLTYDEVLMTAARIKGRVLERHPEYYHEQLMDAIANYVVSQGVDFDKGLLVARVMSRIAHTHLGLVGYLCEKAASNPTTLSTARTNILFGFINCLANNNFIPDKTQWLEIRNQIAENPVFDVKNTALPWTKICLELASLGYYDDKLLSRVFSKENVSQFSDKENNALDYLQLLTLYEAVKAFHDDSYMLPEELLEKAKSVYPIHKKTELIEEYLSAGLGGAEYVVTNVVLPNGFIADCLICLKGGYPVQFPIGTGNMKVPIGLLNIPSGSIPVCLLNFQPGCFSMNSNRLRGTFRLVLDILEKQGYAAVAINVTEFLTAPVHERTPYLLREVGYKCGEIGMKLAAT
uniref:FAST kinase leucine-rich domain-containing protein n=1 Tax=Heliothis virescens TaxID=7102 RepID=A0A2A4IZL1_HELVI